MSAWKSGNAARRVRYKSLAPALSGVRPGCGVWSRKSSAKSSSNTAKLPPPCTSSVLRRTTAFAASLALLMVMICSYGLDNRAQAGCAASRACAGFLTEKLQLPGERDAGAAAVLGQHFTNELGRIFASPITLQFASHGHPGDRNDARHHHAMDGHL